MLTTRTLIRAAAASATLTLTGVGAVALAGAASAWTPDISATCTTVTAVNHEGEVAHIRGDVTMDVAKHGSNSTAVTKPVMVVSWYWDNDDAPPRGLTVRVPAHCVPPTTTTPTTAPPTTTASTAPPTTAPCEEDEPCWDCATMGNHICGTTTTTAAGPTTTVPYVPPTETPGPTVPVGPITTPKPYVTGTLTCDGTATVEASGAGDMTVTIGDKPYAAHGWGRWVVQFPAGTTSVYVMVIDQNAAEVGAVDAMLAAQCAAHVTAAVVAPSTAPPTAAPAVAQTAAPAAVVAATPTGALPVTGGTPWLGIIIGCSLLAAGGALVVATRRRGSLA